ncbi:C40 family peptidase [Heyndrickxia sporothermodurans]|uniref:C40 family peptidase n=1 Tax=Heyndrickxia sporothermodurans TaxID=46224 RepID=UPI003D22C6AF
MKRIASLLAAMIIGITLFLPVQSSATYSAKNVIKEAKKHIGTPYKWGGVTPKGFDCSGFVYYSFKKNGKKLPHSSSAMYKKGTKVKKSKLKPGDLIFFKTNGRSISHVAIYIGKNKVIHSVSKGVKIDNLKSYYWKTRYVGAKRLK